MHLVFHGGKCCGIKTIYELGVNPEELVDALPADGGAKRNDILYNNVSSDKRFFHLAAPKEMRVKRLDRYIEFVETNRPQQIIEINLAVGEYYDQSPWFPVLEQRGFIRVNQCRNSNTGNIVHVFHLNIGEG